MIMQVRFDSGKGTQACNQCVQLVQLKCTFIGATVKATARGTACSFSTQIFSPRAMLRASSSLPCVHEGQMTEQAKFQAHDC
jgi:hypothetical protein